MLISIMPKKQKGVVKAVLATIMSLSVSNGSIANKSWGRNKSKTSI